MTSLVVGESEREVASGVNLVNEENEPDFRLDDPILFSYEPGLEEACIGVATGRIGVLDVGRMKAGSNSCVEEVATASD